MVLLVNVVCAFIFCMICHFSNGIAEKDSENVMCPKKACQDVSNPFDITRNDAVNGLKGSDAHETHPGDMFRDIGGSENIKKISEVHDNGYYTSLCWIEITTITELQNGSKSAIREYAITFETPSDIPEKYISKSNDLPDGETTQYTLFDRDTKKSEVVNFTTISKNNDSTVRQNRKILCGSGPVFTKEFMEWPHSDRKRVEIRVSPKRQTLVASDCSELIDNVEKISTLSPTRRDFASTDTELPTGEGSDGTPTLNYPTSGSPNETTSEYNKVQPSAFDSDRVKEIKPIEYGVGSIKTTIESVSSSPVVYESSAEPQVQYEGLKSGNLKPNKTFPFVPKLQQHPENSNNFNRTHPALTKPPINVTIQLKSVTKVSTTKQPEGKGNEFLEAKKKLIPNNVSYITATTPGLDIALQNRTTGILNDEDLTPTDFRPVKVENETERDSNIYFTKLAPHEQTSSVTKDTSQLSEDSGATETLHDIGLTESPTKVLPLHKTPTNTVTASFSDKDSNTKLKKYNLDNKTPITELSKKDLDYTPYDGQATEDFRETVHTKRPSEYSPATNKYDKNVTSQNKPKLKLPKPTQQPPELSKEVSNLPIITESNVLKAKDYSIPQTVNDISDSVVNKTPTSIATTVTHWELPTKNSPIAEKNDRQIFPENEVKWMTSKTSEKPQESSFFQTEVSNLPNTERIVEVEKTTSVPQILKDTSVPDVSKTFPPLPTLVTHWELPVEYTPITADGDTRAFAKKTPKGMSSKTYEKPQKSKSSLLPRKVSNLPNIERTVEVEKSTKVPHILEDVPISVANKTSTPLSTPVTHWKLPMEHTPITAKHGTKAFAGKTPKGMSYKSSEEPQKSSLLPINSSNLPSTERAVEVEKTTGIPHILKDISTPVGNKTSTSLSTPVTHWELPMKYTPITAEDGTKTFAEKTPKGMSSKTYEKPQKSSLLPTKVSNLQSTERTIEVEKSTSVPHILKDIPIPVRNETATPLSTPVTHWELPLDYTPINAEGDTRAIAKKTPKGMSSKTYEKLEKSSLLPTKVSNLPSTEHAAVVEKTTSMPHILKDVSIPVRNKTSTSLSAPVTHWELPMKYTSITTEGDIRAFAKKTPKGMSSKTYEKPQKSSLLPTNVSDLPSIERTEEAEKITSAPHILKDVSIPVANKTSSQLSTPVTQLLPLKHTPKTSKDGTRAFADKTPEEMASMTSKKPQKSSSLPTKVSNLASTGRIAEGEKSTSAPHILKDISIPVANKTSTPLSTPVAHLELPMQYTPITTKDSMKPFDEKTPEGMSSITSEKLQKSPLLPTKASNLPSTERIVEGEKSTSEPHILKDISIPVANKTSTPLPTSVTHWELPMEYTPITTKDSIKPFDEKTTKGMSSKTSESLQKSSLLPTKASNLPKTERIVEGEKSTSVPHILKDISIPVANKTSTPLPTSVTHWELPMEYTPITTKDSIKPFDEKTLEGMSSKTSENLQKSSLLPTKASNLPSTERIVEGEKSTSVPHILKDISIPVASKSSTPLATPITHWELPIEYTPITTKDSMKPLDENTLEGMSSITSEKLQKSSLLPTEVSNLPSTERIVEGEKSTSVPHILKDISIPVANKTSTPLPTSVTHWELPMEYTPITTKDSIKPFDEKTPKGMSSKTSQNLQKSSLLPTKASNLPSTERIVEGEKSTSVPHILKDISIPVASKSSTPLATLITHWELPIEYTPITTKDSMKPFDEKTPEGMSSITSEKPQKSSSLSTKVSNLPSTERIVEGEKSTSVPHILKDISIPVANKTSTPLPTSVTQELPMEYTPITTKDGIQASVETTPKGLSSRTSGKTQKSSLLPTKVSNLPSTERIVEGEKSTSVPHILKDISIPVANKSSTPLSTPDTHWEVPIEYTPITAENGTKIIAEKTPKGMSSNPSEKPQKSSLLSTTLPSTERTVEVEKTTSVSQIYKNTSVPDANKTSTPLPTSVTYWELPMEYTPITTKGGIQAFVEKTPKRLSSKTSEKSQKSSLLPTKVSNLPSTERIVEGERSTSVPHILKDISIPGANKTSTSSSTPVAHWEHPMEYTPITAKDSIKPFDEKTPKGMSSKTTEKPQKSAFLPTKVSNLPSTERTVEVEKSTSIPHILKDIAIPVANKTSTPLSTPITQWEFPIEYTPITTEDGTKVFAEKTSKGMSLKTSKKPQKSSFLQTEVSNLPNTERIDEVEKTTSEPQLSKDSSVPDASKTSTPLSTPVTHWEHPMEYTPITAKDGTRAFAEKTPKGMSSKTSEKPQKSPLLPTKVYNLPSTESIVEVEEITRTPETVNDTSFPVLHKTVTPLSKQFTHWDLPVDHTPIPSEDGTHVFPANKPKWTTLKTSEKPQKPSLLQKKVYSLPSTERTVEVGKTTSVPHILKDISIPVANEKYDNLFNLPSTENVGEVGSTREPQTVKDVSIPVFNKTLMPLSTSVQPWELSSDHPQATKKDDVLVPPKETSNWMLAKTSENPQKSPVLPTKISNLLSTDQNVSEEESTWEPQTVNDISSPVSNKTPMPLSTTALPWELSTDYPPVIKKHDILVSPKEKPNWILAQTSEEPQKSLQNVIEEGDTTVSHPITDNYEVNNTVLHVLHETFTSLSTPIKSLPTESTTNHPEFITHYDKFIVTNGQIGNILSLSPAHDNVMTTEQSFIATDRPVVKSTETDLETKTNSASVSVAISTFNTPATKRLRSGGISILKTVTLPAIKYHPTKIMKHKYYSIPKEKDQFVETHLKSSTTESVRPATTINVREDSTVNKFENNTPTGLRITLPSTRFLEDSSETDILPISKQENQTKSFTTSLDQINLKSIKPPLSQIKSSRRPVDDNNISRQTSSVYLPNRSFSTSAYDLELDRTVDTFSESPQSHTTDREHVPHAKETTDNDIKIVEKEHIPTEISITSSQKYSTADYVKDTSKQLLDEFETTTAVVSPQSVQKTELFSDSPRNYTSDHVLYQSQDITKPPQKQNTLTYFYSSDDDISLTTTDNFKDRTSYIETDTNTPRSTITNIDFDTFYGSTREGSSRDFIKSDNLIEQSSSTPKNIIFKSSTRTDSETSSTEPSGITGHVGASKSFSNISPTSSSDEMLTTKGDLGKPKHPTENIYSTDTYFSRAVDVSDKLSDQFGITTVGKPLLDERVSTKLSEEKLTNTSPKLVSSYVILPESMPSYPASFGKPIVFTPEKIKSNVYLTSSQAPSSTKYVSLKPTHKPYSRMPSVHPRRPHFTEGFASTDSLSDQFRASTTTVKYPSEMFPTRNEGSTTSDGLFMSPHQNTPKDRDFEHNLHSKSPGIQFKYTTPAESFTSDKVLDDYQPTSNHEAYSGLPFTNPTTESSITDNKLSDKLVDMFSSTISPSLTQQTVPVAHEGPYSTLSTQLFTSSEKLEHYNRTIKDKQLKQEVSSELPSKHATNVSSWLFHKDSNNTTPEISVLSTESSPLNSPWPTNKQEQYIHQINLQTPSKHSNKTVLMEYSTTSHNLTEEFEGTTELSEKKPTSKTPRTTENLIEGDLFSSHTSLSHPSDRYSSAEMTSVVPLLGQSQSSPKIQEEKYLTSSSSTTSGTLTDSLTTITNMLPMFSTIHPSAGYQKKPIIPLKNSNAYEDADESVSDSTKTTNSDGDVATSTRSSTEKLTHILKSLDKPICSNPKQKISVRVKILMEHILEKNESGTIKKQVIPIMGIVKRTEFDIKPKKRLPVVPQKKLNQDWNVFLDDLANNFFDFNRAAVKDYSELKPTSLNLNVPGYGFGGDILAPKENIQRMQQIRNWMNPCRRTHGTKASREVSSSQYIMDENSTPFRIKYAPENLNSEMNLKLTTQSQDQLSTDFYRFLLGSSSGRSLSEIDNKPTKVGIPTKLMLPFNERSRINMVKELRNWPRKPNVVLRTLPYMTPVPGSYRTGYNQFSLSDLFPISSISERNKYIPTIVYRGPTQVGSDLFPSYSSASNNRGYSGLSSYSPRLLIDVGPTGEEYRPGAYRNSFEKSATSLNPNNAADKEIATVKSLNGQKLVNENLNKTQINTANVVKINKENLHSKLGSDANSVKKDTNNSRSQTSHKVNLNGNPNTLKSENVNLHPTAENQQSTQTTFIDFRSILDGIINKLNAVLEKLTKR